MKIKDEFEDIIQATLDTNYPVRAIENNPMKCVKIAEEFAVGFLRWVDKNYYQGENYNCFAKSQEDFISPEHFTIEELLKEYKNEL